MGLFSSCIFKYTPTPPGKENPGIATSAESMKVLSQSKSKASICTPTVTEGFSLHILMVIENSAYCPLIDSSHLMVMSESRPPLFEYLVHFSANVDAPKRIKMEGFITVPLEFFSLRLTYI